jgi:hypothetical protein
MGNCRECAHEADGECRRYPPTPLTTKEVTGHSQYGDQIISDVTAWVFPRVSEYDWCGEYKEHKSYNKIL